MVHLWELSILATPRGETIRVMKNDSYWFIGDGKPKTQTTGNVDAGLFMQRNLLSV